jgi:uncharacterized hydrophobic protein (TIGR00271 family)
VLQVRVFIPEERSRDVASLLESVDGARHVVLGGTSPDGRKRMVPADLTPAMTDHVMRRMMEAGVLPDEIDVVQAETVPTIEAGERSWLSPRNEALVWNAVVNQARVNARFGTKYAVFMAIAGVIAAFGVLTENAVLIVGAMALAPDLTPVTATSVGLVGRRPRLAGRGLLTLALGYAFTIVAAYVTSAFLRVTGQLPAGYSLPIASVEAVATYSMMIVIIALAAGVAGIFAFETRAGSAVGVAISVTTVPAAAYIGASLGMGQTANTAEAFVTLVANVLMLVIGASAGLMVQLSVAKRRGIVATTAATTAGKTRSDRQEER